MTTDTLVPKQRWQTIQPLLPHHHAAAAADLASTTARRWPGSSTAPDRHPLAAAADPRGRLRQPGHLLAAPA